VYEMTVEVEPAAGDWQALRDGLDAYNRHFVEVGGYDRFAIFVRDDSGAIVAGLDGGTYWGWLHVEILWVHDGLRGQGVGRALMEAAEDQARRRGCHHSHLSTMDFQAPGFYEKLGYTLFGQLDDVPLGHTRYFMQKALL